MQTGLSLDEELLSVSAMLHDVGLTEPFDSDVRPLARPRAGSATDSVTVRDRRRRPRSVVRGPASAYFSTGDRRPESGSGHPVVSWARISSSTSAIVVARSCCDIAARTSS